MTLTLSLHLFVDEVFGPSVLNYSGDHNMEKLQQGEKSGGGDLESQCAWILTSIREDKAVSDLHVCQNFAWRLSKLLFSRNEMRNKNCCGRKGKVALDPVRLNQIREMVERHFPDNNRYRATELWKSCTSRIDTGIRNLFRNK